MTREGEVLTVGFVVTPGFPIMGLAALSVFEFANVLAGRTLYDVQILSELGGPVRSCAAASVETAAYGEADVDTFIVGGNTRVTPTSGPLLASLARASETSRRICSICTGTFALADAGLLAGRRATTHWLFADEMRARFPEVTLTDDRLFVVDGPIWTAAGNSAGIDLTLRMLGDDHGSDAARAVADVLVVEYQRGGGQPQRSALLDIDPKSDRIQDALNYARRNLSSTLTVETLAEKARLSPRHFSRAFRAETGVTPAKAVEDLRLDAARVMIEQSRHSVDEIAAHTGFGDEERMRRAFLRVLGRPPQALRRARRAGPVHDTAARIGPTVDEVRAPSLEASAVTDPAATAT